MMTEFHNQAVASYFDSDDDELVEDRLGMRITSGRCSLRKDSRNLIGISIGGGAPNCPCVYIVQVFDDTPASADGQLESGDELTAVGQQSVKSLTRQEVVELIKRAGTTVELFYNKLHAEATQGKTLDIALKKLKHRIVERLDAETADAFGLSRAIIANDSLAKRVEQLDELSEFYEQLVGGMSAAMRQYAFMSRTQRLLGECFVKIAQREEQRVRAAETFRSMGDVHRQALARAGVELLRGMRPVFVGFLTYLRSALPDMRATLKKYLDCKFEYLSYCLKARELDDEEHTSYAVFHECIYRVETGNYEYRLVLRCRSEARRAFLRHRVDVLEKLELLEVKHVENVARQIRAYAEAMRDYHAACAEATGRLDGLFPIESDMSQELFHYRQHPFKRFSVDEEDEVTTGEALASPTLTSDLIDVAADDGGEKEKESSEDALLLY